MLDFACESQVQNLPGNLVWLRGLIEMADGRGPALNKPTLEQNLPRLDRDKTRLRIPSQVVRAL